MQVSSPKLSVLIPTYNREIFVKKAIESVLNQDFQDFEIICSDNASSDATFEVLQEFARKDSRIKVYENATNLGAVPNWKNCLDHASGEYVHWLWSDDWIEPNFYIDAFELLERDQTQMLTTWNFRSDNQNNEEEKYLSWQFSHAKIPGIVAAKKILLGTYELPVSPAAYIIKREFLVENFYIDIPKISELLDPVKKAVGVDSLMVAGTASCVDYISVLQKPSVVFRQHDNISSQLTRDGILVTLYTVSHLWFLAHKCKSINMEDFVHIFSNIKKSSFKSLFNFQLLSMLFIVFKKALSSSQHYASFKSYASNKAFFHKKVVATLDENSKKFDISNKRVYLAPCNDVTQALFEEFVEMGPKSIAFIDNYKKGEDIFSASQVKEYDAVFIYSPNYHKEITASLPKGNKYLLYRKKNNIFSASSYGWYSVVMMQFFLWTHSLHGVWSYLKKLSLFKMGSQIVYLSESMKKRAKEHKQIYITPNNHLTQQVALELQKLCLEVSVIDQMPADLQKSAYLYVYTENGKCQNQLLCDSFSKENLYYLYYAPKRGFETVRLNFVNIFFISSVEFFKLLYLNTLYKTRLFFANILKRPIHSNEKKILQLKKKHLDGRAFIIGNGPSLKIEDLDKLKNEVTFAANKIYLAYEQTSWRPTYYSVEDNLVMQEIHEKIVTLNDSTVILPMKDIWEHEMIDNALYYPLIPNTTSIPKFSKNILSGIYPGHTVTYSMMQMAAYMGVKEIYFIGVDFSYSVSNNADKGSTIYHNNEKNHFHKDYRNTGDKWVMPNYEAQIRAYESAARFCESKGIKIFNASRKTALDVFERVNFDDLF